MKSTQKYLKEIDLLRGVAILLTLIAHLAFMQIKISPMYSLVINHIAQFWGGVILFFTISGFVISHRFMQVFSKKNCQSQNDFQSTYQVFYLRRFYRIFPTSTFWIFFTVLFTIQFNHFGSFGSLNSVILQSIAALFFVYNALSPWIVGAALSIFWSLSFEEQFYFIFPFLSRMNVNLRFFTLVAIIIIFTFIHRPADQSRLINSFPLDAICYGVLIAQLHQTDLIEKLKPSFLLNKNLNTINFLFSLLIIIFSPIMFRRLVCGTSILVLFGAWLVFCASFGNKYISLNYYVEKVLYFLGKVSFSLYCCHMSAYLISREITYYLFKIYHIHLFFLNFISFILAVFFCIIFTIFSFFVIEKPSRNYGINKTKKDESQNYLAYES